MTSPMREAVGNGNFNQLDLHIHAGIERPIPLDLWVEGLMRAGRKVLGLLDHYELYLKSDEAYATYLKAKGFPRWYANGLRGFREFCQQMRQQGERCGIQVLLGLEVYHGDFPNVQPDFLEELDFVGCHISKTESFEPWGDFLLYAACKLSQTAHEHGLVGVLFHPLDHSFWAHRQGMTPTRGLPIVEPDRLDTFAAQIATLDICFEINWGSDSQNLDKPCFLDQYLPVIDALKAHGVPFWLGSDVHHSPEATYDMERLCASLGIGWDHVWHPPAK